MAAPAVLEARREETAMAEAAAAGHGAQGPREPQVEDRQAEGRMEVRTAELSLPRGAET